MSLSMSSRPQLTDQLNHTLSDSTGLCVWLLPSVRQCLTRGLTVYAAYIKLPAEASLDRPRRLEVTVTTVGL